MVRINGTVDGLSLPREVEVLEFDSHADDRGVFAEIYRDEWPLSHPPVQWSLTQSTANSLRGVHLHFERHDYVVVAAGQMHLALHDLRPDSATHRTSSMLLLTAEHLRAVRIPPGVAHGFCFTRGGTVLVGTSSYWDASDEFGCRWDAPELELHWPCSDPVLSLRDSSAGTYGELAALVASRR